VHNAHIISQVAAALYSALRVDLPDLMYRDLSPGLRKLGHTLDEAPLKSRRPSEYDVELRSFPQSWPSTALGLGGIGGAAITSAQTTIVTCRGSDSAAVYFGERLAYVVTAPNATFASDMQLQSMASRHQATDRYAAMDTTGADRSSAQQS